MQSDWFCSLFAFSGLDCKQVEPCCWMTYTAHRNTKNILEILDTIDLDQPEQDALMKKFGLEDIPLHRRTWWQTQKPKLWLMFEQPFSSTQAKVLANLKKTFPLV